MDSKPHISIVVPSFNNADTIENCLEAVFSSKYNDFEVVVVDDCSQDNSVEIIKKFPCKLICLEKHSGTSKARNTGAINSNGDIIFFTDADCILKKDTLSLVERTFLKTGPDVVIGGTYTTTPYDKRFFSIFQSVYINYSETKNVKNPDYIAAHAMIIDAKTFRKSSGFPEDFMPIIEDVEFSHRLRRAGYKLVMNPEIQVQHIFNFSLTKSLCNAFKKTRYWTMYSLKNKNLLVDSGTASRELKTNVGSYSLSLLLLMLWIILQKHSFLYPLPLIFMFNGFVSRRLLKAFYDTKGILFVALASMYYTMAYPLPVCAGAITGMAEYILKNYSGIK